MVSVSALNENVINDIESYFKQQSLISLATVEGDQPRVRIVSLIRIDREFYVITGARGGAETAKVRQIKENPKIEFVMQVEKDGKIGNIRATAMATILVDPSLKSRLFEEIDWVKSYFPNPEHPDYVLLGINVKSYEYSTPGKPQVLRVDVNSRA
jgi:uncharacterized pyridoxamine 5'-phosphate oxidase family protein